MSSPERRYWDSNCFVAWIKGEKGRVGPCEEIIQSAYRGDLLIVTSAITVAEVVRPKQKGTQEMTEAEDARIVTFFRSSFLRFVDFNQTMGQATRQLQWRYNLSVRDAIHVASAIAVGAPVIESYDSDLLGLDRSKIPGCPEIRQPKPRPQATIFQVIERDGD